MEEKKLKNHIDNGLSIGKIATFEAVSKSTVRYWLGKYNLQTKTTANKLNECVERVCPKCSETKPISEYYDRRNKKGSSPYCKSCTNNQTTERQKKFKQSCIDYKGGECVVCGYNKFNGALEFHHLDPSEKDFTIAHSRHTKFDERVKAELDKCILVCSNCHREIHGGLVDL